MFSDSNMGKSIYAVQIANEIAQTQPVLYFDFELSQKQFQMRYSNDQGVAYRFPDKLYRAELAPGDDGMGGVTLTNDSRIDRVEALAGAAISLGARVIIIDNLTFMCNDSESGMAAHDFMMKLCDLKRNHQLSVLVLAHTPKRDCSNEITQNDLAGSKRLFNFFDSVFAIGRSYQGENMRYIKQLKARSTAIEYGRDNVLVAEIDKSDNFLQFVHGYTDVENAHLKKNTTSGVSEANKTRILSMRNEGKTIREIASELDMSKSVVGRFLKVQQEVLDL